MSTIHIEENYQSTTETRNLNVSMSFLEIAKELNITQREAKDAYNSAIRKLKHPKAGRKLKEYLS